MSKNKFIIAACIALTLLSCSKEQWIDEPGNLVPKTAVEDPSIPAITVNGVKLHTEAFGHPDSTIVVFLHGGPGGDYRGLLNARQLADSGYRVVFYDQRGSGLSQRLPYKSYSDKGLAALDDLYSELDGVIAYYRKRPGQKVYLVGHSWGGILATGYAARYPARIQGLVVAEPGGLNWNDIKEFSGKVRAFGLWSELLNDATYLDQFISGKQDQHTVLDYKMALVAARNDVSGEDYTAPASFWRWGATINTALVETGKTYQPDFAAGIDRLSTPVLFMYSSGNKAYTDAWAQHVSSVYPSVSLYKINGTGHSGMFADKSAWSNITMRRILQYFHTL